MYEISKCGTADNRPSPTLGLETYVYGSSNNSIYEWNIWKSTKQMISADPQYLLYSLGLSYCLINSEKARENFIPCTASCLIYYLDLDFQTNTFPSDSDSNCKFIRILRKGETQTNTSKSMENIFITLSLRLFHLLSFPFLS